MKLKIKEVKYYNNNDTSHMFFRECETIYFIDYIASENQSSYHFAKVILTHTSYFHQPINI